MAAQPTSPAAARSAQLLATVKIADALTEAVTDLGSVPSGHLYAYVMQHLTYEEYTALITALVDADRICKSGDMLYAA